LNCNVVEERANGDFVLSLTAPFERMWFSLLMGFGRQVEVLEPEELRTLLREKAEEILSLY
jgi:predicted DNA-binding transcriptional regulator YafY